MPRPAGREGDGIEQIEMCLNCTRSKCNNCLSSVSKRGGETRYHTVPVRQYSLDGIFLAEYPSYRAAANAAGTSVQNLRRSTLEPGRTAVGYRWEAGARR